MFKKIIAIVTFCILGIASMWAVWEGNAAVGSAEEFPSGLFASSELFPKHTLVEIVNLEQNTKSRAVIIENTGAEGVLIKLSPDLAVALAVRKGTTVRVRVSIPPLVAEEGADPVLLTTNSSEPAAKQEAIPTAAVVVPASEPSEEPLAPQEVSPVIEPVREPVAVAVPSEVEEPQKTEVLAAQEEPQPIAEVQEPVLPTAEEPVQPAAVADAAEPVAPLPEDTGTPVQPLTAASPMHDPTEEDTAVYTEPVADVPNIERTQEQGEDSQSTAAVPEVTSPEEPVALPQSEPAVAEAAVPARPPEENEPPLYDTDDGIPESLYAADDEAVESEEESQPVAEVSPIEQPDELTTNEAVAEVTPVEPEEEVPEAVAEVAPVEPEEEAPEAVAEVAPVEPEEEAPEAVAEVTPVEPEDDTAAVEPEAIAEEPLPHEDAVPLVAAEPEPKASSAGSMEEPLAVVPVEQHIMLVPAEPKAPRQEDVPSLPPTKPTGVAAPQTEAPVVTAQQPPVHPAEELFVTDGLQKGSFYVQIARFTDMLNVQSFVQRYGKQYPISVEKNGTGSGSFYKVYIGPLQKDERGAALETFQRLGFKDAFLKKAP